MCLENGDHRAALDAVEAALVLDPDFLAAHALRDRIRAASNPQAPLVPPVLAAAAQAPAAQAPAADSPIATPIDTPPVAAPAVPLVSAERYASFEQRARRRRVDRRLDAARAAIARGRLREAESALEEVVELDPNVPDLPELMASFDALRRGGRSFHAGRWLAAAAAFAIVVVGASSMQRVGGLARRAALTPPPESAPDATPAPSVTIDTAVVDAVATAGGPSTPAALSAPAPEAAPTFVEPVRTPDVREAVARPVLDRPAPAVVPASVPVSLAGVSGPIAPPLAPPVPAFAPSSVAPPPPAAAPVAAPVTLPPPVAPPASAPASSAPAPPPRPNAAASSSVVMPTDEALVEQVLQRYRSAYEGLDAKSARAVWPAVNESALARAFDGLESQSLVFDNCDVSLKGEAAAAICRGSARYVPKVGSHEPRVEPRTWNFTLRKNGPDWTIESARAQR